MTLSNPDFAANARIRNAAENAPPMRRGEADAEAVRILQSALVRVGAATLRRSRAADGTLDGDYGGETVRAVQRFQQMMGLTGTDGRGDGIAGRTTWRALDRVTTGAEPVPAAPPPAPANPATPPAETPATVRATSTVSLPAASRMLAEYRRFRDVAGKPCQRGITNQCAIRMSVALMRCDIGFHFDNPRLQYTHRGGGSCGVDQPHNAGAQRLFDHLRTIWTFTKYDKRGSTPFTALQIYAAVTGRPGIIFFKNCFTRAGSTEKVGDHIDYWDGAHTMNDLLDYHGPGERDPGEARNWHHFFEKSEREVWFCPIALG